jgi:serine/threonine-protein kinase RsbW
MGEGRVEIRFPGTHAGFAEGFEQLCSVLDAQRVDSVRRYKTELLFEELVANIIEYGATDGRELDVRVTLEPQGDSIVLTFDDNGPPFDPRRSASAAQPQPRPPDSKAGGFGLMLVHRAASSIDYLRTADGRNRLTVTVNPSNTILG